MRFVAMLACLALATHVKGIRIKLQCDDVHKLYANGKLKSSGSKWNELKTVDVDDLTSIAFYCANGGGPKGMAITIDGEKSPPEDWKCKNDEVPNWLTTDTSTWPEAVGINGPWKHPELAKAVWMWAEGGGNEAFCRLERGNSKLLKMRVDDDVRIIIDGNLEDEYNEFKIPGWQWRTVATRKITPSDEVVAIQIFDQGGGRFVCGTLDGKEFDPDEWLCKDYPNGKDPDVVFPGWYQPNYDDKDMKDWYAPQVRNIRVNTGGLGNLACWWHKQGSKGGVCRYRLKPAAPVDPAEVVTTVKLQCDDEHELYANGEPQTDFEIHTVWNKPYTYKVTGIIYSIAWACKNSGGGPSGMAIIIGGKEYKHEEWMCRGNFVTDWSALRFRSAEGWSQGVSANGPGRRVVEGTDWEANVVNVGRGKVSYCRHDFGLVGGE